MAPGQRRPRPAGRRRAVDAGARARVRGGADRPDAGSVSLDGRPLNVRTPRDAIRAEELVHLPDQNMYESKRLCKRLVS